MNMTDCKKEFLKCFAWMTAGIVILGLLLCW